MNMNIDGLNVLYCDKIMDYPPKIHSICLNLSIIAIVLLILGGIVCLVSLMFDKYSGVVKGGVCILISIALLIFLLIVSKKYCEYEYTGRNIYGCSIDGRVDLNKLENEYTILNHKGKFIEIEDK